MTLDIEDFRAELDELGLPSEYEARFFDAIVLTMQVFVDRAFGLLPVQKIVALEAQKASPAPEKVVLSKGISKNNLRAAWAKKTRAGKGEHDY